MSDSVEARMARIEEAILYIKENNVEARESRKELVGEVKELKSAVDGLSQNVKSTGDAVARLSLEKCGERLDDHENRIKALEAKTQNLPTIETEIMFWRRVLGGGFKALWKICAALIGSGFIGAAINKYWH